MAQITPNLSLTVWNELSDPYDSSQLVDNFVKIDAHDHSSNGGVKVPNSGLVNSKVTVGSTDISLGATSTTITGLTSVTSTEFIGALTGNANTATNLAAGTTTLASNVVNSSLVKVGALSAGTAGYVKTDASGNLTSSATVPGADVSGNITGNAGTVTNGAYINVANTFTGTQTIRAASTQDSVVIAGRTGGTNSYGVTVTPATLTDSRTLTLPDATGTVALTSQLSAGSGVTYDTVLPGSPTDGTERYYHNATYGYSWHLRYSSTLSAWEFLGGSPYITKNVGDFAITGSLALVSGLATMTVPLAGDYEITLSGTVTGASTNAGTAVGAVMGVLYPTTMTSGLTNGAGSTTFTVTNRDAIVAAAELVIVSSGGTEWMNVTSISGTSPYTITVTRQTQGTSRVAHSIGDPVYCMPYASATNAGILALAPVYAAATVANSGTRTYRMTGLAAGAQLKIWARRFSSTDSGSISDPLISIKPIKVTS